MSNVDINVDRRTDGQTDGRMENRTPISHPATSRCDKKQLVSEVQISGKCLRSPDTCMGSIRLLIGKKCFYIKTYIVGTHWNYLIEPIPMSTHKLCSDA